MKPSVMLLGCPTSFTVASFLVENAINLGCTKINMRTIEDEKFGKIYGIRVKFRSNKDYRRFESFVDSVVQTLDIYLAAATIY